MESRGAATLDWGGWSTLRPGRFMSRKSPSVRSGWVGPRPGVDMFGGPGRFTTPGIWLRELEATASCYTEYYVPAPIVNNVYIVIVLW